MEKLGHILSCACAKLYPSFCYLPFTASSFISLFFTVPLSEWGLWTLHGDSIDVSLACGCLVDAAERRRAKTMRWNKKVNGFICYTECMKITVQIEWAWNAINKKWEQSFIGLLHKGSITSWKKICFFMDNLFIWSMFTGIKSAVFCFFPEAKAAVFHVCADRKREPEGGMGVITWKMCLLWATWQHRRR